jgi:hypothetical protein
MGIKLTAFVVCLSMPFGVYAQHTAKYNVSGDEALARGDYGDARMYYSEGLDTCDLYSIGGLMWVWMGAEAMRPSMENLMARCEACLTEGVLSGDSAMIALLEIGYSEHIFTSAPTEPLPVIVEPLPVDTPSPPVQTLPPPVIETDRTTAIRPCFMAGYHASPDNLLGLGAGALWGKWGGYVRYKRSRPAFNAPQYDIRQFPDRPTEVRPLPAEGILSITKNAPKRLNGYRATAGVLYEAAPWMWLSFGVGYGERTQLYRYRLIDKQSGESSSAWCTWPDYNHQGLAIEGDVALRYRKMFVSAGCAVTGFTWAELNFGVGILF